MTCRTSRPSERRARWQRTPDRQGFTLLELLLAIGVMCLVLGLGLPRISAVRTAYLAAEEAREVGGLVRAARLDAIANRTLVGLAIAPDRDDALELRRLPQQSWRTGEDTGPIAATRVDEDIWDAPVVRRAEVSGRLRLAGDAQQIMFFANGTSTGGEIVLCTADARSRYHFRIDPDTGDIVTQREDGS